MRKKQLLHPLKPLSSTGTTCCRDNLYQHHPVFFRRQPGWALSNHTGWALMTLWCI